MQLLLDPRSLPLPRPPLRPLFWFLLRPTQSLPEPVCIRPGPWIWIWPSAQTLCRLRPPQRHPLPLLLPRQPRQLAASLRPPQPRLCQSTRCSASRTPPAFLGQQIAAAFPEAPDSCIGLCRQLTGSELSSTERAARAWTADFGSVQCWTAVSRSLIPRPQ